LHQRDLLLPQYFSIERCSIDRSREPSLLMLEIGFPTTILLPFERVHRARRDARVAVARGRPPSSRAIQTAKGGEKLAGNPRIACLARVPRSLGFKAAAKTRGDTIRRCDTVYFASS